MLLGKADKMGPDALFKAAAVSKEDECRLSSPYPKDPTVQIRHRVVDLLLVVNFLPHYDLLSPRPPCADAIVLDFTGMSPLKRKYICSKMSHDEALMSMLWPYDQLDFVHDIKVSHEISIPAANHI